MGFRRLENIVAPLRPNTFANLDGGNIVKLDARIEYLSDADANKDIYSRLLTCWSKTFLPFEDGQLIEVQANNGKRLVRIYSPAEDEMSPKDADTDALFVTDPLTRHNLLKEDSPHAKLILSATLSNINIPTIEMLSLTPIATGAYYACKDQSLDLAIREYAADSHYFHSGDTIAVKVDGIFVYLRVDSIESGGKAIERGLSNANTRIIGHANPVNLRLPRGFDLHQYCEWSVEERRIFETLAETHLKRPMKQSLSLLVRGRHGSGRSTLVRAACAKIGLATFEISLDDCIEMTPIMETKLLESRVVGFLRHAPCAIVIRDITQYEASLLERAMKKILSLADCSDEPNLVVVIAGPSSIPLPFRQLFRHEIDISAPDLHARVSLLAHFTKGFNIAKSMLEEIANQATGLTPEELLGLVELAVYRMRRDDHSNLRPLHFDHAMTRVRERRAKTVAAAQIPKVYWDEIAGLEEVKQAVREIIQWPIQHAAHFDSHLGHQSGILLYGPPGTGKTMTAKAIATECSVSFIAIKGPELINMYVGESEANVRAVFERAREARPCILFFDELDSLAAVRGKDGDSDGVMDRIVAQMLTELDGLSRSDHIFVIAATNRPDLIDSALLRPGRFDKCIYLGIPSDLASKVAILKASTKRYLLSDSLEFAEIARSCPNNMSPADLTALCTEAMRFALERFVSMHQDISDIELGSLPSEKLQVKIGHEDFVKALLRVKPSASTDLAGKLS